MRVRESDAVIDALAGMQAADMRHELHDLDFGIVLEIGCIAVRAGGHAHAVDDEALGLDAVTQRGGIAVFDEGARHLGAAEKGNVHLAVRVQRHQIGLCVGKLIVFHVCQSPFAGRGRRRF